MDDSKKTKAQLINELSDLRGREQTFRSLVEHSPDLMVRFDKELRYVYVNPALCRASGIPASAYLGQTHREVGLPEAEVRFWDRAVRQVFETGQANTEVAELETAAGSRIFEARLIPEFAPDGSVETVISLAHDITKREQVQEVLQTNQNRLALAVEVTGLSIYDHAVPLDETTYHSERWGEILGYELAELPPPAERLPWVFEQVHPDDLSTISTAYADFVEGRTPAYSLEIRMKHKSGHWIWVTGYSQALQRDEQGRVTRVLGIMQDITKHKQLEQLLRRQAETLQTIIDNIPVMIAFLDPAGRFILVNRAWEQTLGWRLEEVKNRFDLLSELYPDPKERQLVLDTINSDEPGWHEFKTTVRNGHVIDTAWTQVRLSDGTLISLGEDISKLKNMRDQLYQVQRMDSIGRLAGGIAHDLNNMLVPILGYAELGMLQLSPGSELYTNLTHIKTGAERAAELTRQILALAHF